MPVYEVRHIAPLTPAHKDALAAAITTLHSQRFTTPRLFVNVIFRDVRNADVYVAGRRRPHNSVHAGVRSAASRTQADWDALCADVHAAWARIVHPDAGATVPDELELRAIFIVGGLIAASEAGVAIPGAGQDAAWARANMGEFEARAAAGDEDFAELVRELKMREEFGVA